MKSSMWRNAITQNWFLQHALMFGIVLIFGIVNGIWAEKILVGDGMGWDGVFYAHIARDFHQHALVEQVSSYSAQRLFPIAIVHYGLRICNQPLDAPSIIKAFELVNLLLLLITLALWVAIANHWKLNLQSRWLGFIGLFANFAVVKLTSFNPVLTDYWAFMLGMLMFYCFLQKNVVALFATTLVGAFTWPVLIYSGVLLIAFPCKSLESLAQTSDTNSDNTQQQLWLSYLVAALAVAATAVLIGYSCFYNPNNSLTIPPLHRQIAAGIGLMAALFFVFQAVQILFRGVTLATVRNTVRSLQLPYFMAAIAVLVLSKWVLQRIATDYKSLDALVLFFKTGALMPTSKILLFYVAHVIYFGPVVFLFLFHWRQIARVCQQCGMGMMLLMVMTLMLALDSETRHLTHVFPILVALLVKSQEEMVWDRAFFWFLSVASLLFSKFWLQINRVPLADNGVDALPLYFLNFGPWMTPKVYALNSLAVAVCGVCFYAFCRVGRNAAPKHGGG